MNRLEAIRRYIVLLAGIFFIALGVSMFTKSGLGTSAISVIPLTFSLEFPQLSYGTWVALFNILLLALEWAMLRGAMPLREVVQQLVFALLFGSVVDLTMMLLFFLNPDAYWQRLAVVGASCFVMAFGVYLTLICRVGVMAGDGFARALAGKIGLSFAKTRVISDTTMLLIAVALCMLWFGSLLSVREGTVIVALCCGTIVGFYTKHLKPLEYLVLPFNATVDVAQVAGFEVVDTDLETSRIR